MTKWLLKLLRVLTNALPADTVHELTYARSNAHIEHDIMSRPAVLGGDAQGCTPEEQALYTNLCILQINEAAAKHGLELARTSFRKPNPKALELVLYHLYAAVVGEGKAAKEFRNIWPVQGNQSKEFNQVCAACMIACATSHACTCQHMCLTLLHYRKLVTGSRS